MSAATRPIVPRTGPSARTALQALGHATSLGFGTGLAMIRLVRLAKQDAPNTGLDYYALNHETASPAPR